MFNDSMDPNIALHMSIQKVIPVLKSVFSVSFHGSTLQHVHRDFQLIAKVLVLKPFKHAKTTVIKILKMQNGKLSNFFFFFK